MIITNIKQVEFTSIRFQVDTVLDLCHARWFRGAIGREMDRPEFHHHTKRGLLYEHPLIRYNVCGTEAMIVGLGEGAFLLRTVPAFDLLRLGDKTCRVLNQSKELARFEVGPCDDPVIYRFQTPYLALNSENYDTWNRSDAFARRKLLQRIVIGNLLSFSKSIGLSVAVQLQAEVELSPDAPYELKPGVELLGFQGLVRINFLMPPYWGIGKSSARGFGTLVREVP